MMDYLHANFEPKISKVKNSRLLSIRYKIFGNLSIIIDAVFSIDPRGNQLPSYQKSGQNNKY